MSLERLQENFKKTPTDVWGGGVRKACGSCGGGCAEICGGLVHGCAVAVRSCVELCMAARVGEETFEDGVFPVGYKGCGTGSDVIVFIPGIPFSRKRTCHSGHAQTCPGTL